LVGIALGDPFRVGDVDPLEGLDRILPGLVLGLPEDREGLDDLQPFDPQAFADALLTVK